MRRLLSLSALVGYLALAAPAWPQDAPEEKIRVLCDETDPENNSPGPDCRRPSVGRRPEPLPSTLRKTIAAQGHGTEPHARRGKDGVADRGSDGNDRSLAPAG